MTIFLVKQLVVFIYIWQNKCVYQNDKARIFESCRRIKIMSSDYIMTMQQAQMEISGRRKSHVRIVLLPGHSRRSQCGQSWNTWIQIFIK